MAISVIIAFLTFTSHGFVNISANNYPIYLIFEDNTFHVSGQFLNKRKDKIFTIARVMVIDAKQFFAPYSPEITY